MNKRTGIYIHIPFCVRKCNYCAFLSFNAEQSPRKEYSEALIREIEIRGRMHAGRTIDTVYIGGGTPSVMDISQLSLIMKALRKNFDIREDAEITLEANPGTLGRKDGVTLAKLQAYRYMGINRLSMGVQSMDNDRLHFMGRIHTREDVIRDFRLARTKGFDNISLDLIFSVPGETTEDALSDARELLELGPEHISCYSLQMEEGTLFYEMAERGELSEVDDEEDRETYHRICELLRESGYEHYEISNFAKKTQDSGDVSPYRSQHNSLYWEMADYIGLGLGASGFVDGIRYRNTADLEEYLKFYGTGGDTYNNEVNNITDELPLEEEHVNTEFDNISEAVFTGLRRREGITFEELGVSENEFWEIFREARGEAEDFSKQGLLIIDSEGLRLTEKGIDISNTIMACFV